MSPYVRHGASRRRRVRRFIALAAAVVVLGIVAWVGLRSH